MFGIIASFFRFYDVSRNGCSKGDDSNVSNSCVSDCDEVHKSGGMKYEGDYYIKIKPDKAKKPFKVLCKVVNGTGKF